MWSAKHLWVEISYDPNGLIVSVGCKICFIFDKGSKSMQCKIDILNEHAGRMTAEHDMPKYGVTRVSGLMSKTKKTQNGFSCSI